MNHAESFEVSQIADDIWCVRYLANHFYFSMHADREEAINHARALAQLSSARLVIREREERVAA